MTVVLRAHDHTPGTPKPWDSDSFSGSWSEYPIRVFPDHDLGACTEVRRGPYANLVPPPVARNSPVSCMEPFREIGTEPQQ